MLRQAEAEGLLDLVMRLAPSGNYSTPDQKSPSVHFDALQPQPMPRAGRSLRRGHMDLLGGLRSWVAAASLVAVEATSGLPCSSETKSAPVVRGPAA